jgi:hypothetical protein
MNLLNLLDSYRIVSIGFLFMITFYIIIISIKILEKGSFKIFDSFARGFARILIVSVISILITIYSIIITTTSFISSLTTITNIQISGNTSLSLSLIVIISLSILVLLGIAILFMESERFVSPLTKEIENLNINNLGKIAIKLLDIAPFILSIILAYSILFLVIYPTNMTLINTILSISQVYLYIIIFDIIVSTLIAYSKKEIANYKDLLGKI